MCRMISPNMKTLIKQALKCRYWMMNAMKTGQPDFSGGALVFSDSSGWLIGTDFTLASTVRLSIIFNDPKVYGLLLQLNGATVNVYDPKAMENSQRLFPTLNYSTSALEACDRADAVLVATEWQEFVDLDPDELAQHVRTRVIVDGRNCLDAARWTAAGWDVYALGRPVLT